jgi:hypothetical protein
LTLQIFHHTNLFSDVNHICRAIVPKEVLDHLGRILF